MTGVLVTVAMPAFNSVRYVGKAIRSVLEQTYTPLQIVIRDDASTDGTYEVLQSEVAAYRGPHRIKLHQNVRRRGNVENYNRLMQKARGEFIVIAHADDVALPHRTERLVQAWQQNKVSLVSSNVKVIDENGVVLGLQSPPAAVPQIDLDWLVTRGFTPALLGAALAWERAVFDRFGPLESRRTAISTDHILPFRAALLRGIAYIPEPLLHYRRHAQSHASQFLHHGDDVLVKNERYLANNIAQLAYMQETLEKFRGQSGDQDWSAIDDKLRRSLQMSTLQWSQIRNQLILSNRRIVWETV